MSLSNDPSDSTLVTMLHARRVDELMLEMTEAILDRITQHDRSKLEAPEKAVFDANPVRAAYGSEQYWKNLGAMRVALDHHYKKNSHHPECKGGIAGMTLIDLVEMMSDWKASGEQHDNGSMTRSLAIGRERFGISDQLYAILENTARAYDWL